MNSPYYKIFKKNTGKINHLFITSYVGVNLINENTKKPDNLSTSWNPFDIESSKKQTNIFLRKSALTFASSAAEALVEDLFSYIIPFTSYKDIPNKIGSTKSVAKKIRLIKDGLSANQIELDYEYYLFVTMIQWRNNLIHKKKGILDSDISKKLTFEKSKIKTNHSNLDIDTLITNYNSFEVPTFKEVISLFTATHRILKIIDHEIFKTLDQIKFLQHFFKEWFDNHPKSLSKYASKRNVELKYSMLNTIVIKNVPMDYKPDTRDYIKKLSEYSYNEFIEQLAL